MTTTATTETPAAPLRGLGAVLPHVRTIATALANAHGITEVGGWRAWSKVSKSDHPLGLAVDFMTSDSRGDQLAAAATGSMEALGIKYVIWKQQINTGKGWEPMADRGSVTDNHYDHVHISWHALPPIGLDKLASTIGAGAIGAVGTAAGAASDAVLGPFLSWQEDAAAVGIKLVAVTGGLALLILGLTRATGRA